MIWTKSRLTLTIGNTLRFTSVSGAQNTSDRVFSAHRGSPTVMCSNGFVEFASFFAKTSEPF